MTNKSKYYRHVIGTTLTKFSNFLFLTNIRTCFETNLAKTKDNKCEEGSSKKKEFESFKKDDKHEQRTELE